MYLLSRIQSTMRQGLSSKYRMFGERRESVTFQNDKNALLRNDRCSMQKMGRQRDIEKIKSHAILFSRDNTDYCFILIFPL